MTTTVIARLMRSLVLMCALASMYASSKCRRSLVYLLIVVALLFAVSDLLIARCQKEWFFLIVGFEPVSYHRACLMQFTVSSHHLPWLAFFNERPLMLRWLQQNVIDSMGGVLWAIQTLLLLRLMKRLLHSGSILSIFPHRRRTRINEPLNHSAPS